MPKARRREGGGPPIFMPKNSVITLKFVPPHPREPAEWLREAREIAEADKSDYQPLMKVRMLKSIRDAEKLLHDKSSDREALAQACIDAAFDVGQWALAKSKPFQIQMKQDFQRLLSKLDCDEKDPFWGEVRKEDLTKPPKEILKRLKERGVKIPTFAPGSFARQLRRLRRGVIHKEVKADNWLIP